MGRRKRNREGARIEAVLKFAVFCVAALALAVGGVQGFAATFFGLVGLILMTMLIVGAAALVFFLVNRFVRNRSQRDPLVAHGAADASSSLFNPAATATVPSPIPTWTATRVRHALDEIDWYQFEKFCAALLEADGFSVERKGGAQPDGGVDLIVTKTGARALIQCKHWKSWVIQEKVVREMLGSMTHFKVSQGAIYTLKGWTVPAGRFANEHAITLVNGDELAESAALQLKPEQLDRILNPREHHCPRCESPMIWREGDFTSFWGCSNYPRCRATLKHSGAR
jgi:hypothetical protein